MFTPEEIIIKAQRASLIAKEVERSNEKKSAYYSKKVPEYYPLYKTAVKNMDDIRVHAEKGIFPYHLFANKSPNQTDKEAEQVEKTYKQVTLPVFMDYQSTVSRAFNDANWSIHYNEESDNYTTAGKTFKSYVEREVKNYVSIENFVKSIIPSIKAIDAMGVVAIRPYELPTIEKDGEKVISNELFEPIPYYYKSSQVVDYEDDEFYLIETNEKSIVSYSDRNQAIGRVYEFYDKENIWKVKQIGKYIDNNFQAELYLNHSWDRVPVSKLKGVPKYEDGKILWQSPFLYAVDNLDLVAMNSSNLQISIDKCAYPYAILLGDECDFTDSETGATCVHGEILDMANNRRRTCSSCNGSGLKSRMSPQGQMIIRAETRNNESELKLTQKPIEYVSPETSILEFLEKNIDRNENRARRILHLKSSDTSVQFNKESETATGSNNDQKALYSFVKPISDQTFDLYQFILDAIGWQRYGSEYKGVNLIYPQTFDFLTEEDYINQISVASEAGLPPFVIQTIITNYLRALFFNEEKTAAAFKLIIDADRLMTLSNDDIALKLSKGTVDKWEEVLHTSSINFVNELYTNNDKFFTQDILTQKEQLIEIAKKKATEIKPAVSIQSTVDKILNPAL